MAQTTIELRRLLTLPGFTLFDFSYQFDDATFKAQLEQFVIDYFYDMEIAFETPDMFKRKFQARWQRIIPYYNRLYNTTLLQYNPLINSKMTEALDQLATSSSTQDVTTTSIDTSDNTLTADSSSTGNTKASDYPQQAIGAGDFLSGESTSDSTTDSSSSSNTTDSSSGTATTEASATNNSNYTKTVEGLTGTSYQSLVAAERENILRIQDLVIAELKPCFMMVY